MVGTNIADIQKVAVLIPCYNEALSIFKVISDFQTTLPNADIYVYDNNSTDDTAEIARKAGATVRFVHQRGKGNVIRKMFADIDADIYIMVDGDATYTAKDVILMIQKLQQDKSDMVVAVRKAKSEASYPMFHVFGNNLFNFIMKFLFGGDFHDVFSGYRAFTKRFVKTFPVTTNGFDIEAELSIHALTLSIPCSEIESEYLERPQNSHSKLNTIKDGFHIIISILRLFVDNKPLPFFSTISILCLIFSSALFIYNDTMSSNEFIISMIVILISILSLFSGLILRYSSKIQLEVKRILFLSH